MLANKVKSSYIYGLIEKDGPTKEKLIGKELYPENLLSSTTIKEIKLWFGSPSGKNDIKSLLGIQIKYINYITGERKETEYQGAKIEGTDVETQSLIIKEGDYLSKMNLGFDEYITHIKFTTIKGEKIEFGIIIEANEKQSVNEINLDNNIILNIRGYYSPSGVRAIGCDYISFKDFCFIRFIDLLRLRLKLKKEEYKKKCEDNYNKYNDGIKTFYRACSLPDACFANILKYI